MFIFKFLFVCLINKVQFCSYDAENGISVAEQGQQKNVPLGPGTAVRGQYSYTAPDGTPIVVQYTADENGFQVR